MMATWFLRSLTRPPSRNTCNKYCLASSLEFCSRAAGAEDACETFAGVTGEVGVPDGGTGSGGGPDGEGTALVTASFLGAASFGAGVGGSAGACAGVTPSCATRSGADMESRQKPRAWSPIRAVDDTAAAITRASAAASAAEVGRCGAGLQGGGASARS